MSTLKGQVTGARVVVPAWVRGLPLQGLYVYDLIVDGRIVYVGCSRRLRSRIKTHLGLEQPVDWIELHGPFHTRDEAEDVERRRIAELRPERNRDGVVRPYWPHPSRAS